MILAAKNFRLLLGRLALLLAALTVCAGACAAALPFLLEGKGVRDRFTQSLSRWTGGAVAIQGRISIASFTSLSVQATGVRLSNTANLYPISSIEAKVVTASINLSSLLRGRVTFKRIEVAAPRVVIRRDIPFQFDPSSFGVETANLVLALSGRSPFPDLELRDIKVFASSASGRAYDRYVIDRVRVDKRRPRLTPAVSLGLASSGQTAAPLDLFIIAPAFELSFRGESNRVEGTAWGAATLRIASTKGATQRVVSAIAPWESGPLAITGELNWSRERASLDNAVLAFPNHSGKGSLALAITPHRALLEGTLAYDRLSLVETPDAGERGASLMDTLAAFTYARLRDARNLDIDMRISAERLLAGETAAGPLALALTARRGALSVDVAELGILGGNVTGRLVYDPAESGSLALKAAGSRLDGALLSKVLTLPFVVNAQSAVHASLTVPLDRERWRGGIEGSFTAYFPNGGILEGDVSRKVNELMPGGLLWMSSVTSLPFSGATLDAKVEPSGIDLNIGCDTVQSRIEGAIRVARSDGTLTGTLSVSRDTASTVARVREDGGGTTKFDVTGHAADPRFRAPDRRSLSN